MAAEHPKAPCPSHIYVKDGKRVDIEWNAAEHRWDRVPVPPGAVVHYCDDDKGHDGCCMGSRSRAEYLHLLNQSKAARSRK